MIEEGDPYQNVRPTAYLITRCSTGTRFLNSAWAFTRWMMSRLIKLVNGLLKLDISMSILLNGESYSREFNEICSDKLGMRMKDLVLGQCWIT